MDSDYYVAYFYKGFALYGLKCYEESINCYEEALKLDPEDTKSWTFKGYSLVKLNHLEEALECFEKVLELDPGNENAKAVKEEILSSKS